MGKEIFWQLPNDYRTMVEIRNNGVPLIEHSPRAGITQAIMTLADMLTKDDATREDEATSAAAASKGTGWFKFFGGGKAKSGK